MTLQTQCLEQEGNDGLLVKFVLQTKSHRRLQTTHLVVYVVSFAHPYRIQHKFPLHGTAGVDLLIYTRIDFLPKTRHSTHTAGMHLTKTLENILRILIDRKGSTCLETKVRPSTLEDMSERKEIHDEILLTKVYCIFVSLDGHIVHTMSKHDALAEPCSTTCIEDVGQIIHIQLSRAMVHLFLMCQTFSQCKELIEIKAHLILGIFLDSIVEDDKPADSRVNLQHSISCVVLSLLTHENIPYAGITDHIFHLRLTTGCIERNRYSTNRISAKIDEQAFWHILGKDSNILLHTNS